MPCKYENTCMWRSRKYPELKCQYHAQKCIHPLTKGKDWPPDSVTIAKDRRIIQLSNLALRFYKHDGWTEELVNSYIVSGPKAKDRFPDDGYPYYNIDLHTQLNGDKILSECVLQHCWFWSESERRRTDKNILRDYGHLPSEYWEKT